MSFNDSIRMRAVVGAEPDPAEDERAAGLVADWFPARS